MFTAATFYFLHYFSKIDWFTPGLFLLSQLCQSTSPSALPVLKPRLRPIVRQTLATLSIASILGLANLTPADSLAGEPTPSAGKAVGTIPIQPPSSDKFINFSTTSLWYLYGFNWDKPFASSHERDLITLEHYQDNAWGDLFFFTDFTNLTTEGRGHPETGFDLYGEVNPRLSLGKLTGKSYRFGPVKDIYFYSGMLEFGTSDSLANINRTFGTHLDKTQLRQLHGMALELDLPGFAYSSINFFWRDDFDISGSTWQITYVWGIPFRLAGCDFMFRGFADYNGAEGELAECFHTSPQFMMDLGAKLFGKKSKLWIGTEVDIWVNEYGVKGQHDVVPQAVLEFEF